jgi:hypothetical protein
MFQSALTQYASSLNVVDILIRANTLQESDHAWSTISGSEFSFTIALRRNGRTAWVTMDMR